MDQCALFKLTAQDHVTQSLDDICQSHYEVGFERQDLSCDGLYDVHQNQAQSSCDLAKPNCCAW